MGGGYGSSPARGGVGGTQAYIYIYIYTYTYT